MGTRDTAGTRLKHGESAHPGLAQVHTHPECGHTSQGLCPMFLGGFLTRATSGWSHRTQGDDQRSHFQHSEQSNPHKQS